MTCLNEDCLYHIVECLDFSDYNAFSRTCKLFKKLIDTYYGIITSKIIRGDIEDIDISRKRKIICKILINLILEEKSNPVSVWSTHIYKIIHHNYLESYHIVHMILKRLYYLSKCPNFNNNINILPMIVEYAKIVVSISQNITLIHHMFQRYRCEYSLLLSKDVDISQNIDLCSVVHTRLIDSVLSRYIIYVPYNHLHELFLEIRVQLKMYIAIRLSSLESSRRRNNCINGEITPIQKHFLFSALDKVVTTIDLYMIK